MDMIQSSLRYFGLGLSDAFVNRECGQRAQELCLWTLLVEGGLN